MADQTSEPSPSGKAQESQNVLRLPVLAIVEGLEQKCRQDVPPEVFGRELLRGFVGLSDAAYGAFWRADESRRAAALCDELMPLVSQQAARGWADSLSELAAGAIQQSIIRYRSIGESGAQSPADKGYTALAFPLQGESSVAACITIVVRNDSPVLSDAGIALLTLLGDLTLAHSSASASTRFEKSYRMLSEAWNVVGEVLAFTGPVEMAQLIAERSRATFGADRVSVGIVKAGKARIIAISGEDTIDRRSNIVQLIQAAHGEVVVSGQPAFYTGSAEGEGRAELLVQNPQQEFLARESGAKTVYSVPLRKDKDVVGIVTFEFGVRPFSEDTRRVIDITLGQIASVFHIALQNDRGIVKRAAERLVAGPKWLLGKEHPWRKAGLAAAVAVVMFGIFGRWEFNVIGNCRLEPSFRRVYAAPFDTTIKAAPVRPGDTIVKGQPVVELDRDEIELGLRETKSKRAGVEKEMSSYLAEQKLSEYEESKARDTALAAEIELLERRVTQSTVRAEFDGVVITGDLREDIGRPVRMGEHLVEVAPLENLVLEIEVDQGDITYAAVGQAGVFTTKARPTTALSFTVNKIRPAPEVRGRSSVYVAEATVANSGGWLRPGMEGAAKIRIGRRNVTWVALRKPVDWALLHLWW